MKVKYKSTGTRLIYSRGYRIVFDKNGEYETDKPGEIAVLDRSRNAIRLDGKKGVIRSKEDPRDPTSENVEAKNYTRKELDALASRLGLDPDKFGTKDALAEAINQVPHRG